MVVVAAVPVAYCKAAWRLGLSPLRSLLGALAATRLPSGSQRLLEAGGLGATTDPAQVALVVAAPRVAALVHRVLRGKETRVATSVG